MMSGTERACHSAHGQLSQTPSMIVQGLMHIVRVHCPALIYLILRHFKLAILKLDSERKSVSMICTLARAAPTATLGILTSPGASAMSRSRGMLLVKYCSSELGSARRHSKLATLEFDRDRKSMSTICASARAAPAASLSGVQTRSGAVKSSSNNMLLVKGAAECLLGRSSRVSLRIVYCP